MTDPRARLPLTVFAIPFGLSGLAGAWTVATPVLGVPPVVGAVLWAIAAGAWVVLLVAYLRRAAPVASTVMRDLRDPMRGPFGALVPVVAILLGGALAQWWMPGAVVLVTVGVVVIGILSAWSLAAVLTGAVDARIFHPGYFLYTLAGGLIGAIGLAEVGAHEVALIAFGVGVFFWIVLSAVVIARLSALPALPAGVLPTLAIFSVPPSVAGLAWFGIAGEHLDIVHQVLLGLMLLLLASQAVLVPRYARLPFGIGTWSFTFTAAAPASYGMHWLGLAQPAGWAVWSWLILAAVTVWIGGIAVRSLIRGRRLVEPATAAAAP
ncbi:hypothetical protein GCM10022240_03290 [Microbacterium kribbense]|uniref:Tellurite resistance protein n=1 Tax=Microbacterium kribbense TaxID=433645 RepID=A0ABP7G1A5_9MICO